MAYVLPNRKAFADAIARTFLKYRREEGAEPDADILIHQKLVRDYLAIETPYRGAVIFHGLGSGKTRTAIAVAEALSTKQRVYVMTPASLALNFRTEIRKFGDAVFRLDHEWKPQTVNADTRTLAEQAGISKEYLDKHEFFFLQGDGAPNFGTLSQKQKKELAEQIEDAIRLRFRFIHYNGLTKSNIQEYAPEDGANPYDDCVVIVDEVHNLVSQTVNNPDGYGARLYNAIYRARNCKVVALSGTPIINRIHEIAYLMNLVRGPIERIVIPFKTIVTWDEEKMRGILRQFPEIDGIEFQAAKKYVMVTRNPPQFKSIVNAESKEHVAVKYDKDLPFIADPVEWVTSIKNKFETDVGGCELAMERIQTEELECLPTNSTEFASLFMEGLTVKNTMMFQRRIQGLVSYYKGAGDDVLPKRVEDDQMLVKVPMSDTQFGNYLEVRSQELMRSKNFRRKTDEAGAMEEDLSKFRVGSRLACNYAVPPELRAPVIDDNVSEDTVPTDTSVLDKLRANPDKYLRPEALKIFSPKLLKVLEMVEATRNSTPNGQDWKNQFVYSQYLSTEGLGVFSAILDANGWQRYKLKKEANQWVEADMDSSKPAYAFYTGEISEEERKLMVQIFNNRFENDFPPSLTASIKARNKKLLCMMMASSAGAEGITLAAVRHVHILEPHWTPARHEQVIGRAIRINSHKELPPEERNVKISFYLSVFTKEQASANQGFTNIVMIRKADTTTKRYEGGEPKQEFISTDEYLYNVTYIKGVVAGKITHLLKQAAVDCEIHRKLHSREKPQIMCMRFDTNVRPEDLAYTPSLRQDERDDAYMKNQTKQSRKLLKVSIKGNIYYMDTATKEVFDGPAFEDNQRLLLIGKKVEERRIQYAMP